MQHLVNTVLAAPGLSTTGITDWIKSNILPLVLIIIAIGMIIAAKAKDLKGVVVVGGLVLIGLSFVGLALNTAGAINLSKWLSNLILGT